MSVHPATVTAPKSRLSWHRAIHRALSWSLAVGIWDGNRALLIRWNGDPSGPLGNPVSHANPTWFVLPDDLHWSSLSLVGDPYRSQAGQWLADEGFDWTLPHVE